MPSEIRLDPKYYGDLETAILDTGGQFVQGDGRERYQGTYLGKPGARDSLSLTRTELGIGTEHSTSEWSVVQDILGRVCLGKAIVDYHTHPRSLLFPSLTDAALFRAGYGGHLNLIGTDVGVLGFASTEKSLQRRIPAFINRLFFDSHKRKLKRGGFSYPQFNELISFWRSLFKDPLGRGLNHDQDQYQLEKTGRALGSIEAAGLTTYLWLPQYAPLDGNKLEGGMVMKKISASVFFGGNN
ncbi:MAG: hypothetical protein JW991_03100 [Candidatus Pacebacteria bacterium]|nr:hypothetical protein [Candidatus Paceibacterota bacterium]